MLAQKLNLYLVKENKMGSFFDEDFTKGLGDIQPFITDYINNMGVEGSEFDGKEILAKAKSLSTSPKLVGDVDKTPRHAELGLEPLVSGAANGTWEEYNTATEDEFYKPTMEEHLSKIKSMSDSPIKSIDTTARETNTLHPSYEPPVTVDLADGTQFTYKDQTVSYENGLIVQEATTYIGSDDDLSYAEDKDRVISRTDNLDGTVTYKFNNSLGAPGQRVEPLGDMQENGVFIDKYQSVGEQADNAVDDVKSLTARIQSLELNPEFAEPGQLEELKAQLQAANNRVIETAALVGVEEENLVNQAITVEEITGVDEAAAVFAAAEIQTIEPAADTPDNPDEVAVDKDKVVTDITINSPHLDETVSADLEEVTTIRTEEGKNAWIEKIRSFYSENPEVATALIRAASAYLQTGKWYVAAAKGLEGAVEGAALKTAADKSVKAQRESLRNNGYTGASINKYLVTGNVEDLKVDFTKKDREMTDWISKENKKSQSAAAVKYQKWYNELTEQNTLWMQSQSDTFMKAATGIYDLQGEDGVAFAKRNAGVELGDLNAMILDYANRQVNGQYVLPRDKISGRPDFKQIPSDVISDMTNIVENFSRIQYKQFLATGNIDNNLTFTNYKEQYYLKSDLMAQVLDADGTSLFSSTMFNSITSNKDGEFAGEAMIMGDSTIVAQIQNGKFDMDTSTDGIQKPTKEQIWKQLAIQWKGLSKDQREEWDSSATKDAMDTTGFLFFANTLMQDGENKGWMKENGIKLFQTPTKAE